MDSLVGMPFCLGCGKPATASAKYCGACGLALTEENKSTTAKKGTRDRRNKFIFIAILAILGFLIAGAKLGKLISSPNTEMRDKTKAFWASMRQIEEQANIVLKDKQLGKYPLTDSGQFDFRNFTASD